VLSHQKQNNTNQTQKQPNKQNTHNHNQTKTIGEYDLKRDLVEINHKAPQWSHNAVWNKKYMEPRPGFTLKQLWADSEHAIAQKTQASYEVQDADIL